MEPQGGSLTGGGGAKGPLWNPVWWFLTKLNIRLHIVLHMLLGIYSDELTTTSHRSLHADVTAVFFVTAKLGSDRDVLQLAMDKYTLVLPDDGLLLNGKKK